MPIPITRGEALELVREGCASVEEAARFLGIRRAKVYLEMEAGRLAYLKIGRRRVIPWRALREYLADRALETHGGSTR